MKNNLYAIAIAAIYLIVMTKLFAFPLEATVKPTALTPHYVSLIRKITGSTS